MVCRYLIVGASWVLGAAWMLPAALRHMRSSSLLGASFMYLGFELCLCFAMTGYAPWLPYLAFGLSAPVFISPPLMFKLVSDASPPQSQGEALGALQCVRQLSAGLGALFALLLLASQTGCTSEAAASQEDRLRDCWAFGLPWLAGAGLVWLAAGLAFGMEQEEQEGEPAVQGTGRESLMSLEAVLTHEQSEPGSCA
eukprot:TRINITY_DN22576_c0_g1_i1.p1 TRINITY_DN22576_c0_g1~~TRINITY_DN22576_c0_g1_i1.p1  ORF type:complete len:197 (-),score=48.96 TRINITY_DN22576_c0_g1_i1:10-600(-)